MNHPFYKKRRRVPEAGIPGPKVISKRVPLEQKPYERLVALLDKEFSIYIRRTYQVGPGVGQCYTCKRYHPLKDLQAGHFQRRRHFVVRYDIRNVRPQCKNCNGALTGAHEKFRMYLVQDIGEDAVKDVEALAMVYGYRQLPREKILELLCKYREINKKWPKEWDL